MGLQLEKPANNFALLNVLVQMQSFDKGLGVQVQGLGLGVLIASLLNLPKNPFTPIYYLLKNHLKNASKEY